MLTNASLRATDAPALDEAVRVGSYLPGQWFLAGVAQVLNPIMVTALLMALVVVAPVPRDPDSAQVYAVVGALLSALVVRMSAQRLADQHGSWRAAFGLSMPRLRDVPLVLGWFAVQLVARFSVVTILSAASAPPDSEYSGSLVSAPALSFRGTLLLLIGAVLVAPAMEELAFRGVVLRGLMRRMSFWPSALASSLLFAGLHLTGATTMTVVPTVLLSVMLFAVLQCLLVRRTGRLGPAMAVHGLVNLVVTAVALGAL